MQDAEVELVVLQQQRFIGCGLFDSPQGCGLFEHKGTPLLASTRCQGVVADSDM
jgi:hypothetical protein